MNTQANGFGARCHVFLNEELDPTLGLKRGEPALFDGASMTLIEAPTSFLRDHYVRSGKRRSPRTWMNAAYALSSWVEYLSASGVTDIMAATYEDLCNYRDLYQASISPRTGQPYSDNTLANTMPVILFFYGYAARRKWYDGDLALATHWGESRASAAADGQFRARGRDMGGGSSDAVPARRANSGDIRPFSELEIRKLQSALGPDSLVRHQDSRPRRDRVISDLGLHVGLRLDEIHQLTTYHFQRLHPNPLYPAVAQPLTIIGKGRKLRSIAVQNWLALDILEYIEHERSAVAKMRRRGQREAALFLGGPQSSRPGIALSQRRLQQIIEEGCMRAGVVRTYVRQAEDGSSMEVTKAAHSIHDLRHTYAVFTYWSEVKAGNSEPWKVIQAQLGHSSLETTRNIYLRHVHLFGEREGLLHLRSELGL